MTEDLQKKLILDILFTFKGISSWADQEPPVEEAALYLLGLDNHTWKYRKEFRKKYNSIQEEEIISDSFQKTKKKTEEIIKALVSEFMDGVPIFEKSDTAYYLKIEECSPNLNKMLNSLNKPISDETRRRVLIRSLSDIHRKALIKKLHEIGKFMLKKEVLQEVEKIGLLKGEYKMVFDFESVPKACEYFTENFELWSDKNSLKKLVKERADIYEDGEVLKDWSVINKRINSWFSHGEKKYNWEQ